MRKIITSTVFILLFSMFSGSVFAGKFMECDEFKKNKRFYGLCNAYHNAQAHEDIDAMADIYRNWNKFIDENGEPAFPDPTYGEQTPICPCWSVDEVRMAACNHTKTDGWDLDFGEFFGASVEYDYNQISFLAQTDFSDSSITFCSYQNSYDGTVNLDVPTTEDQVEICRAAINLMLSGELQEFCTPQ